jgi:hypothetical protein
MVTRRNQFSRDRVKVIYHCGGGDLALEAGLESIQFRVQTYF